MRKLNLLLVSMLFASVQVFGQAVTNKAALNDISQQKSVEFQVKKAEARAFASQNNLPFIINNDEVLMELMYIDDLGQPQYYITNNANASVSISTNKVNTGGGFGYSLDGNGMTVHEWDGGAVLGTHQEYSGRVVMGDGVTTTHYHSTHVAGTMIASGVQANAKGMAPAANLRAFDWNSDEAEMAAEAANGALISNHSYGYGRGWVWTGTTWSWYGNTSISTQEDYLFGFYDSQAQDWDQIAANAPYYLICKSAGNDRGDGPSNPPYPLDGPYDCVSHAGVAKNVLTVAAVEDVVGGYSGPSSVTMSSFSAWGPCDDGRIKPDISANGVSLYSTDDDNNADYTTLSGTSMATPSAAGSAILLQEHYENLNGTGNYMLASTLKALIIHAADEAGSNPGPDYEFGWGLMNTHAAVEVISEDPSLNTIEEIMLNNGGTYQRTVTADGTQPLQVTIVWTDVPGIPVGASLDPSDPMIVNELDLRITEGSNTFYPWKLSRTNPSAAATRNSENNVDNVEMVTIDNPIAGTDYTIVVDHDGSLSGGSQWFSLVVTGIGSATPLPPVADFSANNTNPLTGATVTFTDLSTNAPTSWNWTFNPATVTFMNGTDASSQSPEVTFDVAGTYDVTLEVSNAQGSDTEIKSNYIIASDPLPFALPWTEDFEGATTLTYTSNSASLNGLPDWGYEKTANGRLRFSAGSGFYYSGSHAATLDADPSGTYSVNYLTVTLNLSSYAASENLELSFNFMHHGEETHTNDRVWIRGSNTDSWIEAYDLDANKGTSGIWNLAQMIDIDALLSGAGQTASTSFQIRFGQEDNYPATSTTASDGYTFDDITIQETDPNAYVINTFPYSQSWEDGFGLWVQGINDDFDWSRNSGGTPSSSTGPLSAHDGTWYMYTEASSPRVDGDEAHLEAQFNFSTLQSPELSFYYHMFGISIASLHVDVYNGSWNNSVWSAIGPQQSAQGDPYEQAIVDLSAYGGQENITVRFRGIVGSGAGSTYYSDIAIDLIEVAGSTGPVAPVAEFNASATDIPVGGSVQFTDQSTNNPTEWAWTFDGGTPANSTQQNPSITYNAAGTYTVVLTATNAAGSDTETKTAYITVHAPPVADFSGTPTSIDEGGQVNFTDLSTGSVTSWNWTFAGGTPATSTDLNPSVVYNTAGTYDVTLEVSGPYGNDTEIKTGYITVNYVPAPPLADFSADATDIPAGGTVNFSDLSTGDPTSWSWTFDGGTPGTSTVQNPSVTYSTAGTYTVSLVATNATGSDTETKIAYITVHAPPVAEFSGTPTSIDEGGQVNFTDLSTGGVTSWNWTFAGGTPATSTSQNPSVIYNTAGTYDVTLEVGSPFGNNTEIKTGYITVKYVPTPPVADFTASTTNILTGEAVDFTDLSTNSPTSWSWTFSGGTPSSSTVQNPSITYATAGVYTVELTVTNTDGSDTETKIDYITVTDPPSSTLLSFTDFEGGWGIWTDGGAYCELYTAGTYAWSGSNAANILFQSDVASSFYMTNGEDVHTPGYTVINVEFYFITNEFKNWKDDFWVQYYDGSSWQTVSVFTYGTDFDNNLFYVASVNILETDHNFPTDMKIRFMCNAGREKSEVYIDDITITASLFVNNKNNTLEMVDDGKTFKSISDVVEQAEAMIYPNPAQDKVRLSVSGVEEAEVYIYSSSGQLMFDGRAMDLSESINVSNFEKGIYIVKIIAGDEVYNSKLIKQ